MHAYIKCEKCDCFFHKNRESKICEPCERIKPIGSKNEMCSNYNCGSYYTRYVIDPYRQEIYGEEVYRWMCDNCYAQACNDV